MVLTKDKVSGSLVASNMALMAEANGLGVLYSDVRREGTKNYYYLDSNQLQ